MGLRRARRRSPLDRAYPLRGLVQGARLPRPPPRGSIVPGMGRSAGGGELVDLTKPGGPRRRTLTTTEKLRLIQLAAFSAPPSVNHTLTPSEALALIASLFKEDPIARIDRARLPELLELVTPPHRKPRR